MAIKVSRFLDVAAGTQANQFTVGSREEIASLNDLDAMNKKLLDDPVSCVLAITGGDGRINQTVMWFDYDDDKVLINVAAHRKKTQWIRQNPQLSIMLVNPANAYHWVSLRCTVNHEISEDDPVQGARVTEQLDRCWTKYTNSPGPYGLRDPSINERRVLFVCDVERVATFGQA
jgi:general stress protein 26